MAIPPLWAIAMVIVAIVSAVDVTRAANGDVSVHVGVGTVTIGAIALIWLPALLRLLSLTGGSLKAAGVEASAGGLLSTDDLIDTLTTIRTGTEQLDQPSAEGRSHRDRPQGERRGQPDRRALPPPKEAINDEALSAIARRYEEIRRTQPRVVTARLR